MALNLGVNFSLNLGLNLCFKFGKFLRIWV